VVGFNYSSQGQTTHNTTPTPPKVIRIASSAAVAKSLKSISKKASLPLFSSATDLIVPISLFVIVLASVGVGLYYLITRTLPAIEETVIKPAERTDLQPVAGKKGTGDTESQGELSEGEKEARKEVTAYIVVAVIVVVFVVIFVKCCASKGDGGAVVASGDDGGGTTGSNNGNSLQQQQVANDSDKDKNADKDKSNQQSGKPKMKTIFDLQ
jgi:hypothetical protein